MSEKKSVFEGFQPSNTTPVPDILFDELMPDLSNAELRVLLYIIRRTWGFKKDTDAISFSQFLKGITTKDGRVLDKGCGVTSRGALSKALKDLEARGCIVSHKGKDPLGDNQTTLYSIKFITTSSVNKSRQNTSEGSAKNELPLVPKSNHRSSENEPPVVLKSNQQETVIQKTVKQQTDVQERKEEPVLQQQEVSILSLDQQKFLIDIFYRSKIGKAKPQVDVNLQKHLIRLMEHTRSVEELDSLYEYVQKRLLKTNLQDQTVYTGNLTNDKCLSGWLQERERKAKGQLPNLTEQRLRASTPGSQYIVDTLSEAAEAQLVDEVFIYEQPPEYWTEERIKKERPLRQKLIRERLNQWRQEHELITTGPLAGQPDFNADPWA